MTALELHDALLCQNNIMWSLCKVSTPALRNTVVTSNLPRRKRTIRFRCTWLVTWGQSQPHRDSDETLQCRCQSRTTPSNGPPYIQEWQRGNRAERVNCHTDARHQHIDARKPFVKLTIPERNSTGSAHVGVLRQRRAKSWFATQWLQRQGRIEECRLWLGC